jgi:hypothetical protein
MGRNSLPCFSLLLIVVLFWSTACWAGANAAGSASLSWSEGGSVTNLNVAPSWTRVPLFLRLQNAPDIQQLAVQLNWTPNDLVGPCFYVVPDSTLIASCGWTMAGPGGDFAGDSSYTWSIAFPPGSDKSCVTYWVEGGACSGKPASFLLGSVKVRDSAGAIDELVVTGNATILGGVDSVGLVTVQSTSPSTVNSGEIAELTVQGTNFAIGAAVELRGDGLTLHATAVVVTSPNTLTAVVAVPDSAEAPLDVVVSLPDGRSGMLEDGLDTRGLWWGLWLDSTVVLSGRAGSGIPLYRSEGTAGLTAHRPSREDAAEVMSSQVTLTESCNNIPYCTVPSGGTGVYFPSITGPMPAGCAATTTRNSSTSITYFFCYSGPCTPASPNKVVNLPLAHEAYPRQLTGGHCHADNNRPLNVPPAGEVVAGNTGPTGLGFTINWTWPDVGGAVNSVLYTTSQDTFVFNAAKDTTSIYCVLVPNLELLTSGPGYTLVGATPTHPQGWYGDPLLNQALRQLAVTVADSMPSLPDLGYNDMSLVGGGLFDHQGTWNEPHCGHRFGRNCDLQTRTIISSGLVDNALTRRLRRLIRRQGFKEPYKHSDHWHLSYIFPTGAN